MQAPLVFAAYYCWYHSKDRPQKPWMHWTYPASETNAVALQARHPGEPTIASAARRLLSPSRRHFSQAQCVGIGRCPHRQMQMVPS